MQLGRSASTLQMVGIADIPANVKVNIYVDGYYKGNSDWPLADNARHLFILSLLGYQLDTHAIALEFENDAYAGPNNENGDRNLWLDVIGVSN